MSIRDSIRLFGPAWIALLADSDAASILGGVSTGEEYGYKLIWFVLILSIPLFVIQEAVGRLGAVTNSGVSKLVRQYYSKRVSLLSTVPIFFVDFFTYLSEYSGISIGCYLIGINPLIGLLLFFTLHIMIILSKNYEITEKILILISLTMIISSLIIIEPKLYFTKDIFYFSTSKNFLFFLAVNIGAVVTPPCMLIYQSSATALKYSELSINKSKKVRWVNLETLAGSLVTELVIVFSEIIGTGILNIDPTNAQQLVNALNQFHYIFGIILISSGFLTLIVVSLSSAWGVLEALDKNNYNNVIKIYIIESIPAMIIIALLSNNFSEIFDFVLTLLSLSPLVIAIPAILIGILIRNKKIMKEFSYTKSRSILYFIMLSLVIIGGIIGLLYL
ncbi:NRAMP family divalent metal transporter [Acidianus manzaensis]|uniref:Mn2+ and Fe2+ transporter n=1 Tax=Acidianus manzaensis TaxID=282676 RepID=A0A1W6JYM0_9CREN|nr:divalent metal cation transporter [Acidianus manzaensis]ARM75335.1 Mn2+ and Fe2+ transporter [Acidianus manzaensis]